MSALKLKPFVVGPKGKSGVILRLADSPQYLSLTEPEYEVVHQWTQKNWSLEKYFQFHLSGHGSLNFREAVFLLIRLYDNHFFEDRLSESLEGKLSALKAQSYSAWHSFGFRLLRKFDRFFNFKIITFKNTPFSGPLLKLFKLFLSNGFIALLGISVLGIVYYLFPTAGLKFAELKSKLSDPLLVLVQAILCLSLSSFVLAILEALLLSAGGVKFLTLSLRSAGLAFIRTDVGAEDAVLLPRQSQLRIWAVYFLFAVLGGLKAWLYADIFGWEVFRILALAYFVQALLSLSPFYQSPLLYFVEGLTQKRQYLESIQTYLHDNLLTNFFGSKKTLSYSVVLLASWSLIWLYGAILLFADLFNASVPNLLETLFGENKIEKAAAYWLLTYFCICALSFGLHFVLIIVNNLVQSIKPPLRKVRRILQSKSLASGQSLQEAKEFFTQHPIFSHLSDEALLSLLKHSRRLEVKRGQSIVRQGESGKLFYILTSGQASVFVTGKNGADTLVAVLDPGDSFGEMALLEKSVRRATVRSTTDCTLISLDRSSFDQIFPPDSQERNTLTPLIRRIKLVMDSQALSHLSAKQIRLFLQKARAVEFKAGEEFITEGGEADSVYLIEEGEVTVSHAKKTISTLKRGDLLGFIAVLEGSKRTATAVAKTNVRCLQVEKSDFLKVCMDNLLVMLLLKELSDEQKQTSQK